MFIYPLLNAWKFFGKLGKKHRRVQNFWKSSEIFGRLRKSSEKFGNCPKVLKTTFQHFWIFLNPRKSSEVFGKKSENVGKFSKRSSDIFWRISKIFGNLRKCSEMLGKLRKPSDNFRMYLEVYENFYNIPISNTYGLKISFKNFDL